MRPLFWTSLCVLLVIFKGVIAQTRAPRSLVFRKGSAFFYRMNYKINSLPGSTIFAQAGGFKVIWQLPEGVKRDRRDTVFFPEIQDIHNDVELVYESHGLNGRSCLLKNICQAMEYVRRKDGVMAKILKLLAGSYSNNILWFNGNSSLCELHAQNCPLELIAIDPFH